MERYAGKATESPGVPLLVGLLVSGILLSSVSLAAAPPPASTAATPVTPATPAAPKDFPRSVLSRKAVEYYRRRWGIGDIVVRLVASNSLVRFSYRVLDAEKAKVLNDRNLHPYLVDEQRSLALRIPEAENVGQLRQASAPENGREYWMTFANKSHQVKAGDHVTVIIGGFRAEGLVVSGEAVRR